MPYIGTKAKTFNTFTSSDVKVTDDLTVTDDATIGGDLGIGNTSPSQRLDVQESTVNKGMLVYNTNTTSGASVPIFLASESDGSTTNVSIENAGAGALILRTGATAKGGYGTARMTVGSGGDIDVETGDIFFSTAGKGIVLGATSNTAANTLDDYEEGTWTPVLKDTSTSGTTVAIQTPTAFYTKVGRVCHATFEIQRNDSQNLTGNLNIAGLPFTTAATGGIMVGTFWIDNTGSDFIGIVYVGGGTTNVLLKDTAGVNDYLKTNELTNGRFIYASIVYTTT